MLFLYSLQLMVQGDDAVREALLYLRDLMDYTHLFTLDMNVLYLPNLHLENEEMCVCKELVAQQILQTLASADLRSEEPRSVLRLLQHNLRFLLHTPVRDHCVKDKIMIRKTNLSSDRELTFIRRCFAFFQDWIYKCTDF